jgi:hypothetical protein
MGSTKFVVEVHYGGRFDRRFHCEYLGGQVAVHKDSVGHDKLVISVECYTFKSL